MLYEPPVYPGGAVQFDTHRGKPGGSWMARIKIIPHPVHPFPKPPMKLHPLGVCLLVFFCGILAAQTPPIPKIHSNPTRVPDRVILTWNGDTATTQSVTWRTDTGVTAGVGQIAESAPGPSFDPISGKDPTDAVKLFPAKTEFFKSSANEARYHSVTFTGLKPKTKYVYRVGEKPNWSEWFQFETAAAEPEPFGFIYVGDAQDEIKRHWSRLIRQAYSDMPKAKFILHAGDLISTGTSDAQWGEWHTAAGWINGSIPSIPSPGNHEYVAPVKTADELSADTREAVIGSVLGEKKARRAVVAPHWRAQFTLPEHGPKGLEETCYYLDVQGMRVICLNSMERQQDQVEWLENALKNNPNKWTVVTFHVPMYSTTAGRQKNEADKAVRKFWRPVLDRYDVDLVLQGHDHSYGRSGLMRDDNALTGAKDYDQKGAVYVVSVSGPKMYDLGLQPWMVSSAEKKQFYQLIRVDGDKLSFEARTADGQLYDEFEIRKRKDGAIKLLERNQLDAERSESPCLKSREILFALGGIGLVVALIAAFEGFRRRRSPAESPR